MIQEVARELGVSIIRTAAKTFCALGPNLHLAFLFDYGNPPESVIANTMRHAVLWHLRYH